MSKMNFKKEVDDFEIKLLLKEPYDSNNAILEFHPGAGGVDSQDWAEMLFRMYSRWADKKGFSLEVLDSLDGDEAGIKSVTISKFAFSDSLNLFNTSCGIYLYSAYPESVLFPTDIPPIKDKNYNWKRLSVPAIFYSPCFLLPYREFHRFSATVPRQ